MVLFLVVFDSVFDLVIGSYELKDIEKGQEKKGGSMMVENTRQFLKLNLKLKLKENSLTVNF